jgi:hypothetical protein
MLRVKAVPAFLNNSCTDGVSAALLMSTSGALLGMGAGTGMGAGVTENVQAAITANVWDSFASMPTNYESGKKAQQGLGCLILELEETTIAIQGFGDQYIACLCSGKDVDQSFLRAKLDSLVAALSGAFERLSQ